MHQELRVTFDGYRCARCEHEWVPRKGGNTPRICPKCKSPYYNRPRRQIRENGPAEEVGA